jgi:hypothetical protein
MKFLSMAEGNRKSGLTLAAVIYKLGLGFSVFLNGWEVEKESSSKICYIEFKRKGFNKTASAQLVGTWCVESQVSGSSPVTHNFCF